MLAGAILGKVQMIRRLAATGVLLLLAWAIAMQLAMLDAAEAPSPAVALPDVAEEVLFANGHTVLRTLDLVPESEWKQVQTFRCRLYVSHIGADNGRLAFDAFVTRGGPRVLNVRADGTLVLGDNQGALFFSPPGDPPVKIQREKERVLRTPEGRHYQLLRANDHGVLVEDWKDDVYFFLPFKDGKPHVDARVELLRRLPRTICREPLVGTRWIVWDQRPRDPQTWEAKHHCQLVAYDCERRELVELPLKGYFRIEALEGDLLVVQHRVTLEKQPGFEIISFDLAGGKQTAWCNGPGQFHCIKLRDGIGYLLKSIRDPMTHNYQGKVAAVDFRRQSPALFAQELPPSRDAPQLTANRRGLISSHDPATLIPWAVRP